MRRKHIIFPKPQLSRLAPLAISALAVAARLIPTPRTIDDAFITFRYARNLLAGAGFVYNAGEHVLGTTTPLYTGLMACLGWLTGGISASFPALAAITNAIADGLVCLVLIALARKLGFRFAGWGAALAWAVAPYSVTFAIGGMETSVYVLLSTSMVLFYLQKRYKLAALLAGLCFLTRPDALILIVPFVLDRGWRWLKDFREHRLTVSETINELLAWGLLPAIWLFFATIYFGSPIPHSVAAKSLAYHLYPQEGLIRLLQHYGTPFMENLTFGSSWIGIGLVLYLFFYLLGALHALKVVPGSWPFIVYPWIYFVVFAASNPLIFRWYLTPPLPAYFLFILGGMEILLLQIIGAFKRRLSGHNTGFFPEALSSLLIISIVVVVPTLLLLRGWQIHPDHGPDRPAPEMAWIKLELLYRRAADEVVARSKLSSQTSVLAAGDVGVLGYFSGFPILDTVGLNSPHSTSYYPIDPSYYVINYAIPPRLIFDAAPKFVVILEVYGRNGLLKDPGFWEKFRLLEKIETDIYGSDGLLILERFDP